MKSRHATAALSIVSVLGLAATAQAAPSQDGDLVVPRATIAVPSPCPGPNCSMTDLEPTAQGLRIVYLNFEGVTLTASNTADDARTNTSAIVANVVAAGQTLTIPAFNPNQLGSTSGLSRTQIIQRVVQDMYQSHAPYNVEFVTTRPASGAYSMVVIGGSCQSVFGSSGCAGVALLDCNDLLPSNISFTFPPGVRVGDLASISAQEAAHAFGLSHTNDQTDVMFPTIQGNFIPTSFGSGSIPGQDQGTACNGAITQDSDQLMMDTIGFRGQDTIPPSVQFDGTMVGDVLFPGDTVAATVTDSGTISSVELVIGSTTIDTTTAPPYSFVLPDSVPRGDQQLMIRATDDSGNVGFDRLSVYIANGDEEPCDNGACPAGLECISMLCVDVNTGDLGDVCVGNEDCNSGICAENNMEKRCSQGCDDMTPCPDGFECISNIACWPEPEPEESGGLCSASGAGGLGGGAWMLLALFGLFALRRRNS